MRPLVRLLLLLVLAGSAGCGTTVDLTKGLEFVDVTTGLLDLGIVHGQNKLVPSITFKLKNVSDQTLVALQINAMFRKEGSPNEDWGSGYVIVSQSDGLAPGATSKEITIQSPSATRGSSPGRDAQEQVVRRLESRAGREVRLDSVGTRRRVSHRSPAPQPVIRPRPTPRERADSLRRSIAGSALSTPQLSSFRMSSAAASSLLRRSSRRSCRTPGGILRLWLVGGVLAFAGAMAYAELATLRPRAGGEYVYLRAAYGRLAGFLTGWTSFVAGFSGATAASAWCLLLCRALHPGVA